MSQYSRVYRIVRVHCTRTAEQCTAARCETSTSLDQSAAGLLACVLAWFSYTGSPAALQASIYLLAIRRNFHR